MLIESVFFSGKCRLNCPDCPYKSDRIDPEEIKFKGKNLIEFYYGGDVLDAATSNENINDFLNRFQARSKVKKIVQTTPITALDNDELLDVFQAIVFPQVLDYEDSIDSTGRDIFTMMQETIGMLESKGKKMIQVVQLSDLNVNSIIDNYYLAQQSGSLLVLNISDITPDREEKEYLKYLTRKKDVIATQRVPGTCSYTPGFMLGTLEPVNLLKLFWYLWRK